MANFIKLKANSVHDFHYVNMDLVLEIVPSLNNEEYGSRLIFNLTDMDGDYMCSDVTDTPEEILSKI